MRRLLPLVLIAAPTAARAGPPLITDDPWTSGPNRWEINFSMVLEWSPHEHEIEAPLVDANYGVGEHLQLKLELPWVWSERPGERATNGLGDPLAGMKWRFVDESRAGVDVSTYPQVGLSPPHLRERGVNVLLPLEVARSFGGWQGYAEVGLELSTVEVGEGWLGLAFQVEIGPLTPMAEVHVEAPLDLDAATVAVNLGLAWDFSKMASLLAAFGTGALSGGPDLLGYLGIQAHL